MGAHAEQSIYRFRGASSFDVTRFGNADFAGVTRRSTACAPPRLSSA
jgi:hypothetical protein